MYAFRWFSGFTDRIVSKKDRLSLTQRLSYSVGHVLNDLAGNAWFSYLLVFLTKVAELSNVNTGFVRLLGQVQFRGYLHAVAGVLCDKTKCN